MMSERIKHFFSTTSSCMTAWRWRAFFLFFLDLFFFRFSGIIAAATEKDNTLRETPRIPRINLFAPE